MKIAVEVDHIVVPARDPRATAELLAYILGLEVQGGAIVRSGDGLALDVSESRHCYAFQCAFLLSGAEFDAALVRIRRARIDFYATFDGKGPGELNLQHGARGLYFNDSDNHLFELIEHRSPIKAVAIKFS